MPRTPSSDHVRLGTGAGTPVDPLLLVVGARGRARAWRHRGSADGVIFAGSGAHGVGLRQALDVALLDADDRILWIGRLRPWRFVNHPDARTVVELPVDALDGLDWACGSLLSRVPTDAADACAMVDDT